ncbi:MAG: hypothetical protein AAFX79_09150 [Planctomycetota bacterium]
MRGEWSLLVVGAAVAVGVAPAMGQFSPPPGEPEAKPETQLPEPPPPRQPPPDRRGQGIDRGQPQADFEYEPIYQTTEAGAIIAPARWPDLAALTRNPKIDPEQRSAIERSFRAWHDEVELMVTQNPDLCLEVAQGLFEDLDINDKERWEFASEVMKALTSSTNLTTHLSNAGAITSEQAEANRLIVRDFISKRNQAAIDAALEETGGDQQQAVLLAGRSTMVNLTDDAMRMFRSVLARSPEYIEAAMANAGIDAEAHREAIEAATSAEGDEARIQAMVALLDQMGFRAMFAVMAELRELLPPDPMPELADIGVPQEDN